MLKVAFSPSYAHSLPLGHRFPMEKYSLLPEQLLYEGTLAKENFFPPDFLEEKWILNTHDKDYYNRLKNLALTRSEIRATGFPLSPALVQREIQIATGSVQAALYALDHGIGMNIAGGTHHAFTNRGEGFCLLNDIAITANYLLENEKVNRVLVVDLDVHQGNGTAEIFKNRSDVFTFSMHGEKNYPHRKEQSNLDIGLADGIADEEYLEKLELNLPFLLKQFSPDFIIYQCGVDVLSTDQLGRLNLSQNGVRKRDNMVLSLAKNHEIPIFCCMGGGYSKQIKVIIEAHAHVFRLAQELYS
ncbi:Acetoin utilization deacetylase AcuC [Algoriphagus alkaliphilus]|uniref:Acetoin utilization deacetylase AcuC n=1 Tax=Algoriphagus alkaliphilus TaxID=279824 RepID=A0A1G5Z0E1_9BACT|nr:histone deacetylase [Algoriphagus alkaliphilus]MBA4298635.1 histone deacetylase [Cyclobacterium sp.]SDA88184.1 Acetoin utilization deacetylase AcuC [Algoriphagus alkaliphilus]